jgi:hypothetical protein
MLQIPMIFNSNDKLSKNNKLKLLALPPLGKDKSFKYLTRNMFMDFSSLTKRREDDFIYLDFDKDILSSLQAFDPITKEKISKEIDLSKITKLALLKDDFRIDI